MYQQSQGVSIKQNTIHASKLSRYYFYAIVFILFVLTAVKTQAQDFFPEQVDNGLHIGAFYDLPGSKLADYKASPGLTIGYVHYFEKVTFSINFAYRSFKPKVPVDVEDIDAAHQSITTTSPFTTYMAYLSLVYNLQLSDRLKAYGGANAGMAYTSTNYSYVNDSSNFYFDNSGKQIYAAPKIGIGYAFSNYLELDVHAAYNVYSQGAIEYDNSTILGASAATYSSISVGAGLVFKF
jgi:hypothetical protein